MIITFALLFNPVAVCGVSLFTWGRNANFTLGHNLSRNVPERLETDPPMGDIVQVVNHALQVILHQQSCSYNLVLKGPILSCYINLQSCLYAASVNCCYIAIHVLSFLADF